MHFVHPLVHWNALGKIYGHAYLMEVKEQNIPVSVNAIVFIFQEKRSWICLCMYAFIICSMSHTDWVWFRENRLSIKVKKGATSSCFSLRFRSVKCAIMIFISHSTSVTLPAQGCFAFFINTLTHEHIKYDKIFTPLHGMNCIPCTHMLYILLHNILPHFIDSIKFEMEQ